MSVVLQLSNPELNEGAPQEEGKKTGFGGLLEILASLIP